jgi:hypothetical protein
MIGQSISNNKIFEKLGEGRNPARTGKPYITDQLKLIGIMFIVWRDNIYSNSAEWHDYSRDQINNLNNKYDGRYIF